MQAHAVFYLVFAVQLLLISYYFPRQLLNRANSTMDKYPPADYPKLYPLPIEHYRIGNQRFIALNYVILAVGVAILLATIAWQDALNPKLTQLIPGLFFMVQLSPFMLQELSEYSYFRLMRAADSRTTRSANLTPRRLTNYVSPLMIITAVAMIAASIVVDIAVNQHIEKFALGMGQGTFQRTLITLAINGIFAFIIYINIFGKRKNPHMAEDDRQALIGMTVRTLVIMSIFYSAFVAFREGTDDLGIDEWQPVMVSVFVQLLSWMAVGSRLKQLDCQNFDFDVYKEDAPAT